MCIAGGTGGGNPRKTKCKPQKIRGVESAHLTYHHPVVPVMVILSIGKLLRSSV